MFTKEQLIEKGKHYFKDKNVSVMLATSDGNFFYEVSKTYADSHAKTKKIEVITITREEVEAKSGKKKSDTKEGKKNEETQEEKVTSDSAESTGKSDEKPAADEGKEQKTQKEKTVKKN